MPTELVRASKEAAAAAAAAAENQGEKSKYKLHPRLAYEKTSLRHKHVAGILQLLADVVEVERGALVAGITADAVAVVGVVFCWPCRSAPRSLCSVPAPSAPLRSAHHHTKPNQQPQTSPFLSDKAHPELRMLAVNLFEAVAKHGDTDAVWLKVAEIGGTLGCGARIGKGGKPCIVKAANVQPAHAMFDLADAGAAASTTAHLAFATQNNQERARRQRITFGADAEALHAAWEDENMKTYAKENEFARSCVRILRGVLG